MTRAAAAELGVPLRFEPVALLRAEHFLGTDDGAGQSVVFVKRFFQSGIIAHQGDLFPTRAQGAEAGQVGVAWVGVAEMNHFIRSEDPRPAAGAVCVNLMSSPGAGKTTLLRETLVRLQGRARVGIVEGDIETSLDADRLEGLGASVALVNTGDGFGGECHLDAPMIRSALPRVPLDELDLLVIENVGNLVCPAEFDVGEDAKAMVWSPTEGEEKPLKYPVMFRSAEVVVVNKIDLLPFLDIDMDAFRANLARVNPSALVLEVSAKTGEGVDAWVDWLVGA